jgi:hypothetical protein
MLDEGLTRVFAGTCAGLQDDRRTDLVSSGHDGLDLLQVLTLKAGMP